MYLGTWQLRLQLFANLIQKRLPVILDNQLDIGIQIDRKYPGPGEKQKHIIFCSAFDEFFLQMILSNKEKSIGNKINLSKSFWYIFFLAKLFSFSLNLLKRMLILELFPK